jgi:hypothetical protein
VAEVSCALISGRSLPPLFSKTRRISGGFFISRFDSLLSAGIGLVTDFTNGAIRAAAGFVVKKFLRWHR